MSSICPFAIRWLASLLKLSLQLHTSGCQTDASEGGTLLAVLKALVLHRSTDQALLQFPTNGKRLFPVLTKPLLLSEAVQRGAQFVCPRFSSFAGSSDPGCRSMACKRRVQNAVALASAPMVGGSAESSDPAEANPEARGDVPLKPGQDRVDRVLRGASSLLAAFASALPGIDQVRRWIASPSHRCLSCCTLGLSSLFSRLSSWASRARSLGSISNLGRCSARSSRSSVTPPRTGRVSGCWRSCCCRPLPAAAGCSRMRRSVMALAAAAARPGSPLRKTLLCWDFRHWLPAAPGARSEQRSHPVPDHTYAQQSFPLPHFPPASQMEHNLGHCSRNPLEA